MTVFNTRAKNMVNAFVIAFVTLAGYGVVIPGLFDAKSDIGPLLGFGAVVVFGIVIWDRCEQIYYDNVTSKRNEEP